MRIGEIAAIQLAALLLMGEAMGEPVVVESQPLRPVQVKSDRALGRIIVQANFRSHRIIVDGGEYPAIMGEYGIPVTSNALHEVTVTKGEVRKVYKLSVDPGATLVLYVDLGDQKGGAKKAEEKKQESASVGYVTVTAEAEAQIYIDGKLISSKTPLKKHELKTGSHTIRVYFFDTKKFSKSREVYVGNGVTMSMNFTKD